jgi:hypothetical protein
MRSCFYDGTPWHSWQLLGLFLGHKKWQTHAPRAPFRHLGLHRGLLLGHKRWQTHAPKAPAAPKAPFGTQAPCSPPDVGHDISDAISDVCVCVFNNRVSEHMGQRHKGIPTTAKTNLGIGTPPAFGTQQKKGKHLARPPDVSTDMASRM